MRACNSPKASKSSAFWTELRTDLRRDRPRASLVFLSKAILAQPDWPVNPWRVCPRSLRDDFYEPDPLTSSPALIPSGILCGDNSSLSYIVARRCRRASATLCSSKSHLRCPRSGLYVRVKDKRFFTRPERGVIRTRF